MTTPIKTALLSVSNKTRLIPFAQALVAQSVRLFSSGGTYKTLVENNIEATEIASLTGMPEIMNGRVKTLHPKVHGGILARRGLDDAVSEEHDITYIDLVVVNLYPFEVITADPECTLERAIENIDIGGPAMIRSAAKNHAFVTVVTDPVDYDIVALACAKGGVSDELRRNLAVKAFRHTAVYDSIIFSYLNASQCTINDFETDDMLLYGKKVADLRYGENPQQRASLYKSGHGKSLLDAKQIHGVELSYNNWVDAASAYGCVSAFDSPACAIVKHASPCAVALSDDLITAYKKAFAADPVSAFGGVIACNHALTYDLLESIINTQFAEVIIAPDVIDLDAIKKLIIQKPKLRILITQGTVNSDGLEIQSLSGGFLVQDSLHSKVLAASDVRHMAGPSYQGNFADCAVAWQVVTWVKSNAIVLVKDGVTIGIGCGQTNRVRSVEIALEQAKNLGFSVKGSVLASDAFFPFRDNVDVLAEYEISAIIQPGGSMRDAEVFAAADAHGISMLLTDVRAFRH